MWYSAPSPRARISRYAPLGLSRLSMGRVYAVIIGSPQWTKQHMALIFAGTAVWSVTVGCLLTNYEIEKFGGLATNLKDARYSTPEDFHREAWINTPKVRCTVHR